MIVVSRNHQLLSALGRTPLMIAASQDDAETIGHLVTSGADIRTFDSQTGATALHFAAVAGAERAARTLLSLGAPINASAPSNGLTPLMTAVWHRHPDIVDLLLSHPDINVHQQSTCGMTALDISAQAPSHLSEVRRITGSLRSSLQELATLQAGQKLIALLISGEPDEHTLLREMRALIEAGEDVDQTAPNTCSGHDGCTPLLIASRDGKSEIVSLLIKAGADIRHVDTHMHEHAAQKAAYRNHSETLRRLAQHPEFPVVRDLSGPFNGYTSLHNAAWQGHIECARALLDSGADATLPAHDGRTAADLARAHGHVGVAHLIERHRR